MDAGRETATVGAVNGKPRCRSARCCSAIRRPAIRYLASGSNSCGTSSKVGGWRWRGNGQRRSVRPRTVAIFNFDSVTFGRKIALNSEGYRVCREIITAGVAAYRAGLTHGHRTGKVAAVNADVNVLSGDDVRRRKR